MSIAHTSAKYDQARAGFEAGATHVTHLFNAMPPFAHRDPGVVGAASDYARHVEMISDGVHLHPAVATCLAECFRRAVSFGVKLESALKAATINPAKAVGLFETLGSVTAGKRADVLVLDKALQPEHIFIGGVKTK